MKVIASFFLVLILGGRLNGQSIPSFTGITLENKTVTIPQDTKGKYTFICFASSAKAKTDLESWLEPVYNKFVAKTGLMDEFYDVNVFFIPVFKGSNAALQEKVKNQLDETAQQEIKAHVLFCKGDLEEVTAALNMPDETPSLYLLDHDGKIIYRTTGAFSEKKFDDIDDLIE